MKSPDVGSFIRRDRLRLIHYVRSLLRSNSDLDAEDVVHDVLTNLLARTGQPAPELLAAYVYRSLKNRVIDHVRTRRSAVSLDAESDEAGPPISRLRDSRPDALELMQSQENRARLFEALQELSDIEREVVIAHEFESVRFKELARRVFEGPQAAKGAEVLSLGGHRHWGRDRLRPALRASRAVSVERHARRDLWLPRPIVLASARAVRPREALLRVRKQRRRFESEADAEESGRERKCLSAPSRRSTRKSRTSGHLPPTKRFASSGEKKARRRTRRFAAHAEKTTPKGRLGKRRAEPSGPEEFVLRDPAEVRPVRVTADGAYDTVAFYD